MNWKFQASGAVTAILLLGGLLSPASPEPATDSGSRSPGFTEHRGAVERALRVLLRDGDAWMEGRISYQKGDGCVSCHQVPFGVWGLEEARRFGVEVDPEAAADLAQRANQFIRRPGKPRPMSWGPLVLAAGLDPDRSRVAGFDDFALRTQTIDGYWEARGQFPTQRRPIAETNTVATMWTMLALEPRRESHPAVAESLERAYAWVADYGDGESTEWLALRSLIEARFGDPEDARLFLAELLSIQNQDGGWSWAPEEPSNALSTGIALYRLSLEYDSTQVAHQPAAEKAIAFLAASQRPDGFWSVPGHLTSVETGVAKTYVYDYWGTAWATIGLARYLSSADPAEPLLSPLLARTVSLSLDSAPMATVAGYLAMQLEADLALDPALGRHLVSLEVDNQPLATCLEALCDQLSCSWRLDRQGEAPRLEIVRSGSL